MAENIITTLQLWNKEAGVHLTIKMRPNGFREGYTTDVSYIDRSLTDKIRAAFEISELQEYFKNNTPHDVNLDISQDLAAEAKLTELVNELIIDGDAKIERLAPRVQFRRHILDVQLRGVNFKKFVDKVLLNPAFVEPEEATKVREQFLVDKQESLQLMYSD